MAVIFFLAFMARLRLPGLAAIVGFTAFLGVFAGALAAGLGAPDETATEGGLPHAHVLLASAGLALMGIAGLSGLFFLLEHRRLKQKRRVAAAYPMPSLEALDRVNVVAIGIGFPLLTLGVVTGSLWVMHERGVLWLGTSHETWTLVAWAIYGGLAAARFAGRQAGRQAAASALAGFAFLLFAVVGVELFS
jgi:ABC-type transport system involved in cytochrome c biogenesis permease subunit